jgi:hypothetical protein
MSNRLVVCAVFDEPCAHSTGLIGWTEDDLPDYGVVMFTNINPVRNFEITCAGCLLPIDVYSLDSDFRITSRFTAVMPSEATRLTLPLGTVAFMERFHNPLIRFPLRYCVDWWMPHDTDLSGGLGTIVIRH